MTIKEEGNKHSGRKLRLYVLFLAAMGFEHRASNALLGKMPYHLSHSSSAEVVLIF
jgi:hypothetical protein